MPRWKGPCGSLSMYIEHSLFSIQPVLLILAYVVTDVIEDVHAQLLPTFTKNLLEGLPDPVSHHLPVGKGIVNPCLHGREIVLSLLGGGWGADQLMVWKHYPVFLYSPVK